MDVFWQVSENMKLHFVNDVVRVDLCPDVEYVRDQDLQIGLENEI